MKAALPADEGERLRLLHALDLLDSPPEPAFDRITRLLARVLDVPIALVSLVDEQRQWFKSRVGLEVSETPREYAFCAHTILKASPLVVADASQDPRFRDNPLVTGEPNIRFYAGVPIRSSAGLALGTLCVIDDKPRMLSQEELDTLCDLGDLASKEVKLRETLLLSSFQLERSREILDASEVRYRSMFELASVGIGFLSPEGGWISVNQSLCDIVGYSEDELNRLSFQDITHPDDLATDLLQLQRLVDGAIEHYQTETRYLHKNGRPVWISLNVTSKTAENGELEYFVAIIKDIHARKVAEEALHVIRDELEDRVMLRTRELREVNAQLLGAIKRQRESDQALRRRTAELSAAIEHADYAYVSMDESGLVTAWNRKAEALFQWSAAEAIGQRLERLIIAPEAARTHIESVEYYLQTGATHVLNQAHELTALRRDGTSITVEVRIKALDIGGEKIFSAFLSDISARKEIEALLEREVRQDMLTGLLNRRALTELLPQAIARADRSKQPFALLFVDLDGFKAVNDDFGHESGDMVLCEVADRLRACLRKVDSAVRLSGDEFVVVVEGVNGLEDGQRVATKLLESIAEPIALHRVSVSVGASVGIAFYQPGTGMSGDAVLNEADARMYEAKRAGKGRIVPA